MLSFEKKLLKLIEKHLYSITLAAITIVAIVIRILLRDFESADYQAFLSVWFDNIKANGGLNALYYQEGNYSMFYQFLIALMTYLPLSSLYSYKILSCIFDFGLAVSVALLTYYLVDKKEKWSACFAYAFVLLSPLVFLNSAAWAQCDAIYTFFAVSAVFALFKDKFHLAFILLGFGFTFKLQTIFIIPFFLFAYFSKKNFSCLYFFWIPLSMVATSVPSLIAGRSIKDLYHIYSKQATQYFAVYMNYPTFWSTLNKGEYTVDYHSFKWMAILFTVSVLGLLMVFLIKSKVIKDNKFYIYSAFILTYTCVLFFPTMHERYSFCYEILAVPILFLNKKTIPLFISLMYMSLSTYGAFLYRSTVDIPALGVINTVTYLLYIAILWYDIRKISAHQ